MRTGVPLLAKRDLTARTWEIDIIRGTFSRQIDLNAISVSSNETGVFEEDYLRSGPIWLPGRHSMAEAAAHPLQSEIPSITVLGPPPPNDHHAHVRINAILRQTMQMFRKPFMERWDAGKARSHRRALHLARHVDGTNAQISSRRFSALRLFFEDPVSETTCAHLLEVKEAFVALVRDVEVGTLPDPCSTDGDSCGLEKIDEDALSSLMFVQTAAAR